MSFKCDIGKVKWRGGCKDKDSETETVEALYLTAKAFYTGEVGCGKRLCRQDRGREETLSVIRNFAHLA